MILRGIGLMLMFLGIASGDSPNLLVPVVIIGAGALIYRAGEKKTAREAGGAGTAKK